MVDLDKAYDEDIFTSDFMNLNNNNYFDSFDINAIVSSSRISRFNRNKLSRVNKA